MADIASAFTKLSLTAPEPNAETKRVMRDLLCGVCHQQPLEKHTCGGCGQVYCCQPLNCNFAFSYSTPQCYKCSARFASLFVECETCSCNDIQEHASHHCTQADLTANPSHHCTQADLTANPSVGMHIWLTRGRDDMDNHFATVRRNCAQWTDLNVELPAGVVHVRFPRLRSGDWLDASDMEPVAPMWQCGGCDVVRPEVVRLGQCDRCATHKRAWIRHGNRYIEKFQGAT